MNRSYYDRGFTLLETVIGLGIAGLLFAALATFFGSGISSNRFQFEQLLTTDSARFAFERLVDDIRAAQTGPNGEDWLVEAGEYHLIFYANVDADAGVERVRYSLAGSDLSRGVRQAGETEEEVSTYHNIRNTAPSYPVFSYYGEQTTFIPAADVTSEAVVSIFVQLVIDVNQGQQPGPLPLQTFVTPRLLRGFSNSLQARLNPVTLDYPADYTSSTNVEVEIFDPVGSTTAVQTWPIPTVNSRLTTYSGEKVNINYQALTVGSFSPDWYVWVGPILVGQSGEQKYYVTKRLLISDVCVGQELADLLATCAMQTASYGTFSKQFQPVLLYQGSEYQDYVKAITFTYDPEVLDPQGQTGVPMLAYWKFDEGNSNVGGDSSDHGHTGSMNNGLGSSQGWTSTNKPTLNFTNPFALEFDGGNDDMSVENASDLSLINTFTFATWIKTSESRVQMLYHSGANTAPNDGFQISLNSDGKVVMKTSADPSVASTTAVNDGAWHHIAVVVQSDGQVNFYKDGVADGTFPLDNNLVYAITAYTGTRYIGENPSSSQTNFEGALDDLRLYGLALTLQQIQTLAAGNEPTL